MLWLHSKLAVTDLQCPSFREYRLTTDMSDPFLADLLLLAIHSAKERVKTLQEQQDRAEAEQAAQVAEGANDEEIAIDDEDDE